MDITADEALAVAPLAGRLGYPAWSMTVIAKARFRLVDGQPMQPVGEPPSLTGDVPYDDGPDGLAEPRYPSDLVPFKPHADIIVVGSARSPGGRPVAELRVAVAVGETAAEAMISGDRRWVRGVVEPEPGEPEPFTVMPLRAERALGGPAARDNPVGTGVGRGPGNDPTPPPNVEHPQRRQRHPDGSGPFWHFGAIPAGWSPRRDRLGTFDDKWLRNRAPWWPDDVDWRVMNAAGPALQPEGYLVGDEPVELTNLIEDHPTFRTALPGWRLRAAIVERAWPARAAGRVEACPDGRRVRELPMHLDTLWLDADAAEAVLVWRGVAEVLGDEFEGVDTLRVIHESTGEPPMPLADVVSMPLKPAADLAPEPADLPDEHSPREDASPPAAIPVAGEPTSKDAAAALRIADERREASRVAMQAEYDQAIRRGVDFERPRKPPAESLAITGLDPQVFEVGALEDPARNPPAEPDPASRPAGTDPASTRERLEALAAAGAPAGGLDLAGLDLSSASLAGLDLSQADLREADLRGANLAGATLDAADLEAAKLDNADLAGVSALAVRAAGASFAAANAPGSCWIGSDFTAADWSGADLEAANLSKCKLERAVLRQAKLAEAVLRKCRAADADLASADLTRAVLEVSDLAGADLRGAKLAGAFLADATFDGAKLDQADVRGTRLE